MTSAFLRFRAFLASLPLVLRTSLARRFALTPDLRDTAIGWQSLTSLGRNDRPQADYQQQYTDTLEAWRKNPYAKRITDLISDYIIGDGIIPTAPGEIGRFIQRFWDHPQNQMDLRLPDLVDELSRAGDLFLVLFRNDQDGMSYIRPIPKSEIVRIETAGNDWEREVEYHQRPAQVGEEVTKWRGIQHSQASESAAVMLHYSINKPVGAMLGESELSTILPWLQRYSRFLEDRVRLNHFIRSILWFVTVPSNRVQEKSEQYANPPEPGSIVVKDDGESWDLKTPNLAANDAHHDARMLRMAIGAGSGQPPHWHGDGGDVNRGTAVMMVDPAVRHLRRRQRHMLHMIIDLCHVAYSRAHEAGKARARPNRESITAELPDISREDNESLSLAANRLTAAFQQLAASLPGYSPSLAERMIALTFKFAGEPIEPEEAQQMAREVEAGLLSDCLNMDNENGPL